MFQTYFLKDSCSSFLIFCHSHFQRLTNRTVYQPLQPQRPWSQFSVNKHPHLRTTNDFIHLQEIFIFHLQCRVDNSYYYRCQKSDRFVLCSSVLVTALSVGRLFLFLYRSLLSSIQLFLCEGVSQMKKYVVMERGHKSSLFAGYHNVNEK